MRHKTIKPKKGVRPTRVIELCPNCNGPLTLFPDPETETTKKVCRVCKYINVVSAHGGSPPPPMKIDFRVALSGDFSH